MITKCFLQQIAVSDSPNM